jgi:hypothetical protein
MNLSSIAFLFQPSVTVRFVNPQPSSGLFEVKLPVFQGDSIEKVKARLLKTDRSKMKGNVVMLLDINLKVIDRIWLSVNRCVAHFIVTLCDL